MMSKNDKNVTCGGHCEPFGKIRTGQGAAIQPLKMPLMKSSGLLRCARNDENKLFQCFPSLQHFNRQYTGERKKRVMLLKCQRKYLKLR